MPIHYDKRDDHVVVITIDRPEARNALDLYHFRDLAGAWKDFSYDDDAWVAIVTGVPGHFMVGADLKTYIPQITDLAKQIGSGEVTEIDGCRLEDGTRAVLAQRARSTSRSSRRSTARAWPAAWRCSAGSISASPRPTPRSA